MFSIRIFRSYKIYTKEEILKPLIGRNYKSIFEICSQYRSQGVGFQFWRATWPADSYYIITRIEYSDPRHGKVWGIKTWKGLKSETEEQIRSSLKLGTWRHRIPASHPELKANGISLKIEKEENQ
ncbi:unnamed protein product [Blepharisma stoltei]|uniref:Uncharacterized protein n=1 Tax=Blepharisma stoltei TaxID=1481888 RepID=A0AAU9IQ62_9CILI|nr:unnamed protein product [Blepharisma stoltei]